MLSTLVSPAATTFANGVPFQLGDVFADNGSGLVNHFTNTGILRDVLNTGTNSAFTTGDCFDAASNLYVTDFSSTISKFDKNGNLVASTFATVPTTAESCVFDSAGNMFVGGPSAASIYELNAAGTLIKTFSVQGGNGTGGTDWVDLAADQCTMLYDGEGSVIKSFNVCTNTQNPDFASGLPGSCFALRIRPNGEVMIACEAQGVRLSSTGAVLQHYPTGNGFLFALNLDPDNSTFWTADLNSNNVFRVRISDGTLVTTFNGKPGAGSSVAGLAVFGEIIVSTNHVLTVNRTGPGTVVSSPSGINCGTTCTATFSAGTVVTLTATPDSGATFVGWGGACSGTGTCSVTMDQDRTVSATFSSGTADKTPPACSLTAVIAGPPKQVQITVQDSDGGLQSIAVTSHVNATVSVPAFTVGTKSAVVVTATKIDQSIGSSVALQVTDVAGNVTNCDPAILSVGAGQGERRQTVHHVASDESKVTIYNETPGVTRIALIVDGKHLEITNLDDGEVRELDVSRLMRSGSDNTVSVVAQGKPGGSAIVLLTD